MIDMGRGGTEGKIKRGLFGQILNQKNTHDKAASEEQETISENVEQRIVDLPKVEDEVVVLTGLEHLWDEFSDPLYVKLDEGELSREYQGFIRDLNRAGLGKPAVKKEIDMPAVQEPTDSEETEIEKKVETKPDSEETLEQEKELEPETVEVPEPIDAKVMIHLSKNRMVAFVYLIEPIDGGNPVEEAMIRQELLEERITYGIDENMLQELVEKQLYYKPYIIARGTLAKEGVDGSVVDHFQRVIQYEFVEDETGKVNYKDLNSLQHIKKDDTICDIIPPIIPVHGATVCGEPVKGKVAGNKAIIPAGRNTMISEDGCQLLSGLDGHVLFDKGAFHVDPVLKIAGNVDGSTGNLKFNGDIAIEGDVRNGFIVEADGNIQIRGSVEGAQVIAGGNVNILMGMMGNNQGVIRCGGDLKASYLENCQAYVKGNIAVGSIICSEIQCDQDVVVTSGHGVIIGGRILAASSIEAKTIGCKAQRFTELILGGLPHTIEEISAAQRELKQLQHNLAELDKNINYLESINKPEKLALLNQLKQAWSLLSPRETELLEMIESSKLDPVGLKDCRVRCTNLFPITKIQIGETILQISDECSRCNIFYDSEGEIVVGTL